MTEWIKRVLIGRPLRTGSLNEELLPKRLALPVFCSDPISSVAYATEQIIRALALGGLALLQFTGWIAALIAVVMVIVLVSYRQTCYAYPNGGGAYVVSRENLGVNASLLAASALLVDYTLTVAVSVAAGVAAITSYAPILHPWATPVSVAFILILALLNLRGARESGRGFAMPTYGFIAGVYVMFAVAGWDLLNGVRPRAVSSGFTIDPLYPPVGLMAIFLALRAFASGCTALTGVEAVSNGVPAFQPPKSKNAANTLAIMGALAITMFLGITMLAMVTGVKMIDPDHRDRLRGPPPGYVEPTALAQIADAVFHHGFMYAYVQATTAGILILAANTAFNGFPVLASILARDSYLPQQLDKRGDRLVFSNGILLLAASAGILVAAFAANTSRLIQLYIIGVFISFTLSQAGMVRHWQRVRHTEPTRVRARQAINAVGAAVTALVLVVVLVTKFLNGAWIVCLAIPAVILLMKAIRRHYTKVMEATKPDKPPPRPASSHAIVLLSRLSRPALQAVAYAEATRPASIEVVHVCADDDVAAEVREGWERHGIAAPLTLIDSPYRTVIGPILEHVRRHRERRPSEVVTVYIVDYVIGHWWERFLHNGVAERLRERLVLISGVMITLVPYRLASGERRAAAAPSVRRAPRLVTLIRVALRE